MYTYLLFYRDVRYEFRQPEIESINDMYDLQCKRVPISEAEDYPFEFIQVYNPSDIHIIAQRSTLIRYIIDLFGQGDTMIECMTSISPSSTATHSETWKVEFFHFGGSILGAEKSTFFETMATHFPLKGKVDLKGGKHTYLLASYRMHGKEQFYFGEVLEVGAGKLLTQYTLKERQYLGTTSMAAEWCFLMANLVGAKLGKWIMDPFTGTSSILVACAHFGALVSGGDIDIRVLRGNNIDQSPKANFKQYQLMHRYIDMVAVDQAHYPWRIPVEGFLDGIVTDPPYGVREGARKIGTKERIKRKRQKGGVIEVDHNPNSWMPMCIAYEVSEIYYDLLDFAARALTLHGRIVFWYPITDLYKGEEELPQHPCLERLYITTHVISTRFKRLLITMEKVHPYSSEKHTKFLEMKQNRPTVANIHERVFLSPS